MKKLLFTLIFFTTTQAAEQYYRLESVCNKDGNRVSVNVRFEKTGYTVNIRCNNDSGTINIANLDGLIYQIYIPQVIFNQAEGFYFHPFCSIQ